MTPRDDETIRRHDAEILGPDDDWPENDDCGDEECACDQPGWDDREGWY